tara:strand:- start:655 stop:885 length:231 start_codon:yes stop_codon:yes gene_type:complete
MKVKKVTYDDTRDISIRCIDKLIDSQLFTSLTESAILKILIDEHHFEIQDLIQDEINKVLGLDIDDNFEVSLIKSN